MPRLPYSEIDTDARKQVANALWWNVDRCCTSTKCYFTLLR
jgi:hypothetical protein